MPTYDQSPGRFNISFRRGDTLSAEMDFSIDVTGYTFAAAVNSAVTGGFIKSLGTQVTNAAEGKVLVSLTEQETQSLAAGTYSWDMSWVDSTGIARTVLGGFVEVS